MSTASLTACCLLVLATVAAGEPAAAKPAPLVCPPAAEAPHRFNPEAARRLLDQGITHLAFVRRFTLTASHVYTEHIDAKWLPGGGLCVLDLATGAVREVLPPAFAGGVVNRFDVSFDATRIVFDFKKSAKEGYRIYEVDVAGGEPRQLTFPAPDDDALRARYGYGTNDMHPCYLSDGSIILTSTRCNTSTLCNSADVYTTTVLHRMDGDGRNLRRLSSNPVSEFSPAVLPDGRILYMRWEYNRKGAGAVKCLWSMRPDGSASAEIYGNLIVDPETMIYGRPIPGTTDKISFLGCSHWGPNNGVGAVFVLDTKADVSSTTAMKRITRDVDARTHGGYSFLVDGKWVDEKTGTLGRLFKDPYPLSDKLFLVAHKPKGLGWPDPKGYDLSLLDEQGRDTLLYRDETVACWHPYPLRPRSKPPMPVSGGDESLAKRDLAQCIVTDVYTGLTGIPRGTVKWLRILEQTPRPWTARNRWKGDVQAMAHTSLGPNVLGMHAQHGIVPVEEDGSASFLVPAGRNIYFQVLDERFQAIQTERTYVNYQPGEVRSCVGCHERSQAAGHAMNGTVKALRRAPSTPGAQPGDAQAGVLFDYERRIQPIWDRHCLSCHDAADKGKTGLPLHGGRTALHNASYENLLRLDKARKGLLPLVGRQVNENDVRAFIAETPPWYFGAATSLLAATLDVSSPLRFESFGNQAAVLAERAKVLRQVHKDVKLPREDLIKVVNWLDASCQYYGSYWGMKNLTHQESPYFRPEVSFEEALAPTWPAKLAPLYAPPAR